MRRTFGRGRVARAGILGHPGCLDQAEPDPAPGPVATWHMPASWPPGTTSRPPALSPDPESRTPGSHVLAGVYDTAVFYLLVAVGAIE